MRITYSFLCLLLASACIAADLDSSKDPKLAQPVTIECVNARLHAVLEQLDQQTGVAIRCGRDKRDWQVRDIPVTVCAKDVPLGRLLQCIASSTHLLLSKEQIGQTTIYRIWRDKKRRDQIEEFLAAMEAADEAARRNALEWEWDAASAHKDGKYERTSGMSRHDDPISGLIVGQNLAGLLTALGPDAKAQVASGGYVQYLPGSVPAALYPYLEPMSDRWWGLMDPDEEGLTPQDMRGCGLLVRVRERDGEPYVCIEVGIAQAGSRKLGRAYSFGVSNSAKHASSQGLVDAPKTPDKPDVPAWDSPGGEWIELTDKAAWELPVLQTKVSLEKPKDKEPATCGSVLSALSKASGFTIIVEDFESHRKQLTPGSLFKKDITIRDILADLDRKSTTENQSGLIWHLNEKEKIIIGTADDWPIHHRNVVSEALLDYLKARLDGDGVDLDDFLKVVALESGQQEEWIFHSPDLAVLNAKGMTPFRDLWMLYDSLTPQQKAQAQTDEGLPMAGIRPAYVAYLVSRHNEHNFNAGLSPLTDLRKTRSLIWYDEQTASSLVMSIKEETSPRFASAADGPEETSVVTQYKMRFWVTQNGETHGLWDNGGVKGIPVYSREREAQLFPNPAQ